MRRRESSADEVCRVFDVPPWLVGLAPRPRFARLRWFLRRRR